MPLSTTLLVISIAIASAPERARIPPEVPAQGLFDLTRQGEVMLLPKHDAQPFNMLLLTHTRTPCTEVTAGMMDVESYTKRFNVTEVRVLERKANSVKYELELGVVFAPTVPGYIENPSPGKVVFHDQNTGADFIWTVDDITEGCFMRYSLLEAAGKQSGWISAVRALNASMVDAANVAAGVASARGYAKPETSGARVGAAGESAFAALAAHGTAIRYVRAPSGKTRSFPVIIGRRVVERAPADVLWSIRDKRRYEEKIDVFTKVDDHGRSTDYGVGAFGGRVKWSTTVTESGDVNSGAGLTIVEQVSGGDLKRGQWVWRVRAVPGGTDVELSWDLDMSKGSSLLTSLAETDWSAHESLSAHMVLAFMGNVIAGKPIGAKTLAQVP